MPQYNITDPQSGKQVTLTGDSPPTESELNDIFSKLGTIPGGAKKQNQPIYPESPEPSKLNLAGQALKGAWNTTIPGLEQAGKFAQETLPGEIAEKSGKIGAQVGGKLGEVIQDAGIGVGGGVAFAGQAIPRTVGDASVYGAASIGKGAQALKKIPGMAALDKSVPGSEALMSGVRKAGSHVSEFMGTLISNLLSVGGGEVKSPWIRAVMSDPGTAKHFGEEFGMDMQQAAVKAIEGEKSKVGAQYRALQDSLTNFGSKERISPKVDTSKVLKMAGDNFEKQGMHVPKELGGKGLSLQKYRFDRGSAEDTVIKKFMSSLKKPLDFGEALNLRRQMDDAIRYSKHGELTFSSEAQNAVRTMRRMLNSEMTNAVPKEMRTRWVLSNQNYEKLMRTLEGFQSQVVGKTPFQTASRIARAVRTGRSGELIDIPSQKMYQEGMKAMTDLRRSVVASKFKEIASKGFSAENMLPGSPRVTGYLAALMGAGRDAAANMMAAVNEHKLMSAVPAEVLMRQYMSQKK